MSEIKTLREKMANIATEARSKLEEITDDIKEERAAEIEREFDAMMEDHDKLQARADREERLEKAQAAIEAPDTSKLPQVEGRSAPASDQGETMEYRTAFMEYVSKGGLEDVSPEARQALMEKRVQVGGTNNSGGFTVPETLATFIVESMKAHGAMYTSPLFTTLNTATGEAFKIPTVDDTGAGLLPVAHTEGTQPTDDNGKDVTFGQKQLSAFGYNTEFIRFSHELNTDSVLNMESFLGRKLGERMARIANSKLTTGSGSSDVEGIMTNADNGVTAASATAIAADELIDLVHSVDPAYRSGGNVAMMMNDSTLSAVRKLKDSQNRYLWEIGGYAANMPQTILGYPVVVNQDVASIATGNKTVLFGDMSAFYVRKVAEPAVTVLRERFFPDFAVLGYLRFDGCLTDTAAVKTLTQA